MATFSISKGMPILLYGAGELGHRVLNDLRKNGYSPVGFVDRSVSSDDQLPVYGLSDIPRLLVNDDTVVIVTLSNGMIHEEIARSLHEIGFNNICYIPYTVSCDAAATGLMIERYSQIVDIGVANIGEMPAYDALNSTALSCEASVIRRIGDVMAVWVPYNLIYVLDRKGWKGDLSNVFVSDAICDRCIATFSEYVSFFSFLEQGIGSVEQYVDLLRFNKTVHPSAVEEKLEERNKLFRFYKNHFNRGMDFFISSAPLVSWNNNGYFNLLDGHHRTIFLYSQNLTYLPVKMSEEDFLRWSNRKKLRAVTDYIRKFDIVEIAAPVEHPAFINLPVKYDGTGKAVLASIVEFLFDHSAEGKSVLDVSGYGGYFARNLSRILRSQDVTCVDPEVDLCKLFDAMLNMDGAVQYADTRVFGGMDFDIAVVMNPFRTDEVVDFKRVFEITNQFVFVELPSLRSEEVASEVITDSSFSSFQVLKKYLESGRMVELGVFFNE